MSGIRVTDEAVAAAVKTAGWSWGELDPFGEAVPTPEECMRPILEAAAVLLVAPILELHRPTRRRSNGDPACGECLGIASSAVPWPCPTLRALGVEA